MASVLRDILSLFQKQASIPERKRIMKASKEVEKVTKLSKRLDELQLDFQVGQLSAFERYGGLKSSTQLLASLESHATLSTIRVTAEASHSVMNEVHRNVLTLGETIKNQMSSVDEDGVGSPYPAKVGALA